MFMLTGRLVSQMIRATRKEKNKKKMCAKMCVNLENNSPKIHQKSGAIQKGRKFWKQCNVPTGISAWAAGDPIRMTTERVAERIGAARLLVLGFAAVATFVAEALTTCVWRIEGRV